MNKLIFAAVLFGSCIGFAASNCPQGTKKVANCISTPQEGDHEIAIGMLDSVRICQAPSKSFLVMTKDKASETAEATRVVRTGGVSYVIESKEVTVDFSMATGTRKKTTAGKLSVKLAGADFIPSSTYTCTR